MIWNVIAFIGELVKNGTLGAPLSTDANGKLVSGILGGRINATSSANITTGTDATIDTMTVTPALAGTYRIDFNTDVNSATSGIVVTYSIYVAGVTVAGTQRKIEPFAGGTLTSGSQRIMMTLQEEVTITAGQTIDVRASTSSGTVTVASRTLIWRRVV